MIASRNRSGGIRVNVAAYVVGALRDQGVDTLFMDPGGLNDTFMAPMTGTPGIRTVVAAFEGGAAYMADGYARATGGLGVCFGIGGPGVLNMVTALAAANADRTPVLAISGEVPRSWEGLGGFQDASGAAIDDVDVLKPVTATSISLSSAAVVPHGLRHAINEAMVHRRPVHVSIPVDVQQASIDEAWTPVPGSITDPRFVDERSLAALVKLLGDGHGEGTVAVLAGPGVLHTGAADALVAFAERFDVPVATSLSAKGAIPENHPLALGVFGYGGSRWAIDAIRSDDLEILLVIGSGLSQRDTMQWDRRMLPSRALVHAERDASLLGRTWPTDVAIVGDAATVLERLARLDGDDAAGLAAGRDARRAFLGRVRDAGSRFYREEDTHSDAEPMHPARVVTELCAAFPPNGALAVDSGAHRAWFAEYWTVRTPGAHLSLTNLGPMGGAVPLGIGARIGYPDRPLMIATGDGCMLMHGMELHTAAREGVPVVIALMNNQAYGNIWYRAHALGPGPERLTEIPGIDWVGFARSMGGDGETVEQPAGIGPAVQRALDSRGPYLLDLRIDKTYPTPIGAWRERQAEWEDHE
jgi:acetolactate synthase-1/2/3 large subunit